MIVLTKPRTRKTLFSQRRRIYVRMLQFLRLMAGRGSVFVLYTDELVDKQRLNRCIGRLDRKGYKVIVQKL